MRFVGGDRWLEEIVVGRQDARLSGPSGTSIRRAFAPRTVVNRGVASDNWRTHVCKIRNVLNKIIVLARTSAFVWGASVAGAHPALAVSIRPIA